MSTTKTGGSTGKSIHGNIRKYYGLLTILCVILGFTFPQFSVLSPYVPVLLAILVFSMVIEHNISDFTRVINHPRKVLAITASNLVLYPIIGILFGYFFLLQQDVYVGIILLCFAPSPVVAALWTELSKGDGTISVTTALFSMMLSILVYPVVLYFMGIASPDLAIAIFKLLALSIFAPAVIALFLRLEEERYIPAKNTITLLSSFVGLFIIVVAIAHMASQVMSNEFNLISLMVILVVTLLTAGFGYGYILGRLFKVSKKDSIAFLFSSSMRDGIIPLSVAITYFSPASTLAATILLIVMPFLVVGVYYMVSR
jgi:BASS family bile acid:Na+ symporter